MRKSSILISLTVCLLFNALTLCAQQSKVMTNADVVEMVKAGLPENTIVIAIQQSQTNFDTSPQNLIELKKQGVSPKILETMLQPKAANSAIPKNSPANDLASGQPVGDLSQMESMEVTLIDGERRIAMKQTQYNMRGSNTGMMIMGPFGKAKVRSALDGNHAQLRITDTTPEFEVSLPSNVNPSSYIALIKLNPKSDRREVEVGRAGMTGSTMGFRKESIVPTTLEEIKKQVIGGGMKYILYRIKVVNSLSPGEYALVPSGSYYDFGIDRGQ